jgi:hypothetical protein
MRLGAAILLLAAIAVPGVAVAQRNAPFAARDEQRQLLDAIQWLQSEEGPYALTLLDPFKTLSLLYRDSGDYRLAIAASQRALQVVRANHGLRSLEQAPLIREQILSQRAIGNTEAAWELEEELLTLAERHPDDLRTVAILRELGDRRMDILRRYLDGTFPPEIYLGCYYDPIPYDDFGSCHSGSRRQVVYSLLSNAWSHYSAAIDVLLRNDRYDSAALGELEREMIASAYAFGGYGVGRASLRRLFDYQIATGAPFLEQVEALVQLADWDLVFVDQRGVPLGLYEIAYEQLKQHGADQESIDRLFTPEIPIVLPTFLPNPLAAREPSDASGYIDVAFQVTKFGKSRSIEILDATANATNDDKHELEKLIARSRFRPMLTDGQFLRTEPIVVRYYLGE